MNSIFERKYPKFMLKHVLVDINFGHLVYSYMIRIHVSCIST